MTGTYGVPLAGYPFRTPISSARADCTSDRRPREPWFHVMLHPGAGLERSGESLGTSGTLRRWN